MQISDNILRTLISSSNDKFDGALEILDVITQLVAERLGATLCATLYRRRGDDGYRLLSIEDSAGLDTSSLPKLERFVNAGSRLEDFTERYVSLSEEMFSGCGEARFLRDAGLSDMYAHEFSPAEGDKAMIIAFLNSGENTSLNSAGNVCRLAIRQLNVVFKFVSLELQQRMFTAFFGVLLHLSALRFAEMESDDTLEQICSLGKSLQGVREVELIGRGRDGARYREAIRGLSLSPARADQDSSAAEIPEAVAALDSVIIEDASFLVALERSAEPAWLLHFIPGDSSGFSEDELQLLSLFSAYASVALDNYNLLLRHRRLNSDLRSAQDRLLEAESLAALGDMASGLAHDFNNLLGGIIGKTQVLKIKHKDSPELCEKLDSIEKLALQGGEQIKRLQEFAIQSSPRSLESLDLLELFEEYGRSERKWRQLAKKRGVTVRFISEGVSAALIEGKSEDITVMLDNIIRNAIEVSENPGVVKVDLVIEAERAVIRVSDSGPGIPSAIKNKIFNPFFSTKTDRGAGLGLSVAYRIATRHGGSISAQSNPETTGTTFTTSFPLSGATGTRENEAGEPAELRAMNIMVVDDDENIREVLADMLQLLGQNVDIYQDGQSAMAAHRPDKYDLVITDLGMPGMSGVELMRALHEVEADLPVALVTGWGAQLDGNDMFDKGAFRLISKPFSMNDIRQLIAEAPHDAL
ncbi:MAG: response regulator [candidate division Zixibacteria bacterium]|nr:response regulator [candidate division Zixibacteria bacterium]